ncbi:hypothetical protein F2Q70_00017597 [Brassica cretica]|uniref:Uncharacterized protein n=1 Tax=Brassica cretica TaxID=69181 RepID=A0A8S9HTW0_BRACR|nr:hypothetical protein F2Q70_00017597 [Brassica cretica]
MAPDACAAAPRAPLVFQHAQMQGDTTPSTCLDAWPGSMQGDTTSSTCQTACFGSMHRDISCLAVPPRASMCHSPCCDHFYCNTSCFPCHIPCQAVARASRSIRPISAFPVNFFVPRSIPIFFDACSDDLSIFNKLQMNPDLTEKYFPSLRLPRKIHNTEIRVSAQLWVFPSCFDPVLLGFILLTTYDISELIFR